MKKIVLLIAAAFLTALLASAQTIPQPNGNIINQTLQKFEGTWLWTNGTDTVKLFLKKDNILLAVPANSRADALIGFHLYKKGNTIVENYLPYSTTVFADKRNSILGGNTDGNDIFNGTIKDSAKQKRGVLTLTLNNSHTQMTWKLENKEGIKIAATYDYGFTLPNNITLVKQ